MPAHRLLPPHMAARSSNRSVELCWCVGQLCNDYPSVPMNSVLVNVIIVLYMRSLCLLHSRLRADNASIWLLVLWISLITLWVQR
ncbi:hypothetical protein OESDEN_02493 [Oesophagostomum dentatum]|uniref:Uncharacterized protein n=1 Tax=Oesophagostomum dentatum TaxID=61180 RepID=A0A0B1TIZ5_OESDE|nr:hypothetical protein OESDEN_02493 [Oesophagostomum dentatum]